MLSVNHQIKEQAGIERGGRGGEGRKEGGREKGKEERGTVKEENKRLKPMI